MPSIKGPLVQSFKSVLVHKMYKLQDEINHLFVNYPKYHAEIAKKEAEISKLFEKLRRVRDREKQFPAR